MATTETVPEIDHSFGQDRKRPGEHRTLIVVVVTIVMMIVEVTAGLLSGSMALLADGLHMAAHAAALGISVAAYVFARRHARNRRFSFGTGKVNALGGFTGAVLLILFSLVMAWESVERLIHPVAIAYTATLTTQPVITTTTTTPVTTHILMTPTHTITICGPRICTYWPMP